MHAALGVLAGMVVGALVAFGLGLLYLTYGGVSQAEGAAAMGVVFFWTPAGAVVGAILGGMIGARI
jgi:hypothetical protein